MSRLNHQHRARVVYVSHSGKLYGTERMALSTLQLLSEKHEVTLLAPEGPVHHEAARLGIPSRPFASTASLGLAMLRGMLPGGPVALFSTSLRHSAIGEAISRVLPGNVAHYHVVHGGCSEAISYGKKHLLNGTRHQLIAVSGFVRDRLIAHGVHSNKVLTLPNFLSPDRLAELTVEPKVHGSRVEELVLISRLDPLKEPHRLLDVLNTHPSLARIRFTVVGNGPLLGPLRERARRDHPNIRFVGFQDDVQPFLQAADGYLHLCPVEPFGLSIMEAMAQGTPVLVPNSGGPAELVSSGRTGYSFQAEDPDGLGNALMAFVDTSASDRRAVAQAAQRLILSQYTSDSRLGQFLELVRGPVRELAPFPGLQQGMAPGAIPAANPVSK